jgi:hypothetical protein
VADIEQADAGPNRLMFFDHAGVLDGHFPPPKSTSFAPRARCTELSGVIRSADAAAMKRQANTRRRSGLYRVIGAAEHLKG